MAKVIVVLAISLTTIAVALIVAAVILMEREQKKTEKAKDARVVYLCDGKRTCGALGCHECQYTTDISHAKNFTDEGTGTYYEKSGE